MFRKVSFNIMRAAGLIGLLLALLPPAKVCLAAPDPAASLPTPLEVSLLTPDQLEESLRAATASYTGEAPEKLMSLLDAMVQAEEQRQPPAQAAPAMISQGFEPAIARALDLLHEWPSSELSAAVLRRLADPAGKDIQSGLRAAAAVCDDPAVAARVLELVRAAGKEQETVAVLGLLALGESRNAAVLAQLEPLLKDPSPARRDAAARAMHALRTALGRSTLPPLDAGAEAPAACVIGSNLLVDYRSLPLREAGDKELRFLAITIDARGPAPFSEEVLKSMGRVLAAGGTVLVANPGAAHWEPALENWARSSSIALPGEPRDAAGPGLVSYADYRAFADFPFELRDQPGRAAQSAWARWDASQAAPVRAANRAGALIVVQEGVMGRGRIVFTTVDLSARPIYRENLLRWIYGDGLLAYTFQFTKDFDFRLTGQTPHVEWMRPIAGPRPKVLYVTSGLFKRGLLELLQRFDADWRYVPYDASFAMPARKNHDMETPGRMGQRAVGLLEESLPWADIVVFDAGTQSLIKSLTQSIKGGMSLDIVPGRLRRALYRRVHAGGMGLLCISNPRFAERGLQDFTARAAANAAAAPGFSRLSAPMDPLGAVPLAPGASGFRMAQRGKGRLFWFNRDMPHLQTEAVAVTALPEAFSAPGLFHALYPISRSEYDYALLIKSMLWTLGRDGGPRISGVTLSTEGAGKPASLRIALTEPAEGACRFVLRDRYNETSAPHTARVGGNDVAIGFDAPAEGSYIAEVQLLDGGQRVVDFAAVTVVVGATVRIEAVEADKRFYAPGETMHLAVRLSAPWAGRLRIAATDTYGRATFAAVRTQDAPVRAIALDVPVREPLSRLWEVEVSLLAGERVTNHFRQPVGIRLPPRELDFDVTAAIQDPSLRAFFKNRLGANVAYGDPDALLPFNFELSTDASTGAIGPSATPGARLNPRFREPCLSSSGFRMRAIADMKQQGERLADLGIRDYTIDDECPLGGRCFAPDSLFRFRNKMKEIYGTLDALNREWDTTFARWDDVQPCQGGSRKRPGAYVDFDLFTDWVFAEYPGFLEMLAGDRMESFHAGHSGGIHDNLMMHLSGALFYYGVIEQAVSMKRPDAVIGSWYAPGYRFIETHETQCRRWPWWHLFRGTTRIQLWNPVSGPPAYHEDLSRPYQAFTWLKEEMDDIRLGIGKLLLTAQRDEGRAAIYHSQRSQMVAAALTELGAPAAGLQDVSDGPKNRWQQALLGQQVECRFLSEYQAEAGEIARRGLKLIILPGVTSLSEKEQAALRAFVVSGGVLVADFGVGARNEHGSWQGTAFAEEMFGVTFDDGAVSIPADAKAGVPLAFAAEDSAFPLPALRSLKSRLVSQHGVNVRPTTGKALTTIGGNVPAVIVKAHGPGKCIFLNLQLSPGATPGEAVSDLAKALAQDLCKLANLEPLVAVQTEDHQPLPIDFGNFRDGDALYAGFVAPGKGGMVADEPKIHVTLTFPTAGYLYDARGGGYLGKTRTWNTVVVPSIALVYASLPYRLTGLRIDLPGGGRASPGDTLEGKIHAQTEGGTPGHQVWLIQVHGPDGAIQEAYTRRVLVHGGETTIRFPLALNAPVGKWQVSVRDAATGVAGRETFDVAIKH